MMVSASLGAAERQAGQGPSLGSSGASGPLRQADLLADPGSEGGGEEGRHCCGFAANEGTYLGYLGMDREPAPRPPGSACQSSATGTCHLRNVFIFSQSLARFPPHSLTAGRGGRRGKVRVIDRSTGGLGNGFLRALCAKKTPWGLPNPAATWSDSTLGCSPGRLPPLCRKSHFTLAHGRIKTHGKPGVQPVEWVPSSQPH